MKRNHKDTLIGQPVRDIFEGMTEKRSKEHDLEEIHSSSVNGNFKQLYLYIEYYGYDFWKDYRAFLSDLYLDIEAQYEYFSGAVIHYNNIKEIKEN
jgi:hypothetical protein